MGEMKSITITKEQFEEAVMKANHEWESIGEKQDNANPMSLMMMSLQNIMFASLIKKVLFDENEEEK